MTWFSKASGFIGGAVKKAANFVKPFVTPLVSFAAGLVPGVGPFLASAVDGLGNALLGDSAPDGGSVAAASPAMNLVNQTGDFSNFSLGASPAAQAMSSAGANGFFGIGGSAPGIFGIGDGKPGVFGIGTGKNSASSAGVAGQGSATPWLIGGAILALLAL